MGRIYILSVFYLYSISNMGYRMICAYCNIEREELYMGGGLYIYKCPKCSSRMEVKQ